MTSIFDFSNMMNLFDDIDTTDESTTTFDPDKFEDYFSIDYLSHIYNLHIRNSNATGLDNTTHETFKRNLHSELSIISRKVVNGTYRFTKFKLKLISKGRGKTPREISIPTIRDRLVLRCLCNYLSFIFKDEVRFELPQNSIKKIKENLSKYNAYIKLDVSDFYPSINHYILLSKLSDKNIAASASELVSQAIKMPTVVISSKNDKNEQIGVPQGLSISNLLAYIYIKDIDAKFSKDESFLYQRYVDDILILCDKSVMPSLSEAVINEFKSYNLKIHPITSDSEKSKAGLISESFSYLGYQFTNRELSPRQASTQKLKQSLAAIFTSFKYSRNKSVKFLEWRLSLRISGCIYQGKCKGWLFFFSEITSQNELFKLDLYMDTLSKRFGVKVNTPRFVKSFYEIKHNKYDSKKIVNYDRFDNDAMRHFLSETLMINVSELDDDRVEELFHKKLKRQTDELLTDIQDFGY